MLKTELSRRAKLAIYELIYILTYGHGRLRETERASSCIKGQEGVSSAGWLCSALETNQNYDEI